MNFQNLSIHFVPQMHINIIYNSKKSNGEFAFFFGIRYAIADLSRLNDLYFEILKYIPKFEYIRDPQVVRYPCNSIIPRQSFIILRVSNKFIYNSYTEKVKDGNFYVKILSVYWIHCVYLFLLLHIAQIHPNHSKQINPHHNDTRKKAMLQEFEYKCAVWWHNSELYIYSLECIILLSIAGAPPNHYFFRVYMNLFWREISHEQKKKKRNNWKKKKNMQS